jgi:hypothetical protein
VPDNGEASPRVTPAGLDLEASEAEGCDFPHRIIERCSAAAAVRV